MSDIYPFDEPELADKILEDLDDLCDELGLTFFIYAGVALGFHREGDYIEFDNDIDVAIIASEIEYRNLIDGLVQLGFEQFPTESYKLHHLRRNSILLDLRRVNKGPPYAVPAGVSTPCYAFQEFDIISHYGREYRVPSPIEDYLSHSYGSWWTPKPKKHE